MKDRWKVRLTRWNYGIKQRGGQTKLTYDWLLSYFPYCIYCNAVITPKNAGLDHKKPLSKGGTDDLSNLQILCKACNRAKGTMSAEQYAALIKFLQMPPFDPVMAKIVVARLKLGWRIG